MEGRSRARGAVLCRSAAWGDSREARHISRVPMGLATPGVDGWLNEERSRRRGRDGGDGEDAMIREMTRAIGDWLHALKPHVRMKDRAFADEHFDDLGQFDGDVELRTRPPEPRAPATAAPPTVH
jgi:hypothetical protein